MQLAENSSKDMKCEILSQIGMENSILTRTFDHHNELRTENVEQPPLGGKEQLPLVEPTSSPFYV